MYQPIEERLRHPPDFKVRYRFYSFEEGGRKSLPHQGYRSDFWYPFDGHLPTKIYMIHPEFEDDQFNLILETEKPVPASGTARMWIVTPKMREYHKNRITIGIKGYFMEGLRKVAECEVVEIIGLYSNLNE